MKKLALLLALSSEFSALPAYAGSGADSFDFLLLDGGARPAALGGAYTALAQDAHALQYNPAGLAGACQSQASFMHNQYFQSINQEVGSVALRQGFGFAFNYLNFGSVPETTVSQIDGTGARVSLTDLSLGAGYGRRVSDRLSLGLGIKYVSEVIAGYTASGAAADLGAMLAVNDRLRLGYAIQNLGPEIKFQSRKESLSQLHRLGAVYRLELSGMPLHLSADVLKEKSEDAKLALGAELTVRQKLGLRVGYNGRNDAGTGLALGIGWSEERWALDYAFVPFGDLGSANRVSLSWRFDSECAQPAPPVAQAAPPPPAAKPAPPLLPPVNSRLLPVTKTSAGLAWDANGNPPGTGYRLELSSAEAFAGTVRTAATTELQAPVGGLESGVTYFLHVQATRDAEVSAFDATLTAVTLAEPPPPKCPNPPPGVELDAEGCPKTNPVQAEALAKLGGLAAPGSVTAPIVAAVLGAAGDPSCPWERQGVLCLRLAMEFEYDKAELKGDFAAQIKEIAVFLKANPNAKIELQGHTDNKGGMDYNIRLSRGRARAVRDHLLQVESVEESRMTAKGFGYEKPAASNDSEEGRQRNRRVMAVLEWRP